MSSVVIYCRSGFESDAAAEITFHAAEQGFAGYVKAKPNTGYVSFFWAVFKTILSKMFYLPCFH